MRKRNDDATKNVALCEKRLLSVPEFCIYSSAGQNKAMEMAEVAGAVSRMGRRVLIDRVKFDRYCDANEILL